MSDRPLTVGVALSLGVHALVVAVLLALARTEGQVAARLDPSERDHGVEVALIPGAGEVSVPRTVEPPLTVASTPAPKIDSAEPRPVVSAPDPAPVAAASAAAAPAAQVGEAAAPPAAAPIDPSVADEYRQRLLQHIAAYRKTPSSSDGGRSAGTVMVRFSMTRSGDVLAVSVASSSGAPDLDDEAVATVWRAGPMPSIPRGLPERLSITLPVTFGPGVQSVG